MTDNNPTMNFNISDSNIASVTGPGKIDTAITHQHNYAAEQKQTLAEAAKEIQNLLEQLSRTYSSPNNNNDSKVAKETIKEIEKNPALKAKIVNAIKSGGIEAFKGLINHPAVSILFASIEGWNSTNDN